MWNRLKKCIWHIRNMQRGDYDHGCLSYSQNGEDLFIWKYLQQEICRKGHRNIRYLDIGANHPIILSNTYSSYRLGASGVLVEPNPLLYKLIRKTRPRDIALNIGISDKNGEMDFYPFDPDVLGTFSEATRQGQIAMGYKQLPSYKVPITSIETLIKTYFDNNAPDILSVDVEGMDETIISAIDFSNFRPSIICIETWDMTLKQENMLIKKTLTDNHYRQLITLGSNTIFAADSVAT